MIFFLFLSTTLSVLWSFYCFFAYRKTSLAGKTVLILGGATGVGRCLALRLLPLGAKVIVWDASKEKLDLLIQDSKAAPASSDVSAKAISTDPSPQSVNNASLATAVVDASFRTLLLRMIKQQGPVDVVVNVAENCDARSFLDRGDDSSEHVLNRNGLSLLVLARACLPAMLQAKEGHFVTVVDAAGLFGVPAHPDYAASQWAAVGAHESIQRMLRDHPDGKKVCATLVVGSVTPQFKTSAVSSPSLKRDKGFPEECNSTNAKRSSSSLWGTFTPDEVAEKCLWAITHRVERVHLPALMVLLPLLRVLPVPWFLRLAGGRPAQTATVAETKR